MKSHLKMEIKAPVWKTIKLFQSIASNVYKYMYTSTNERGGGKSSTNLCDLSSTTAKAHGSCPLTGRCLLEFPFPSGVGKTEARASLWCKARNYHMALMLAFEVPRRHSVNLHGLSKLLLSTC